MPDPHAQVETPEARNRRRLRVAKSQADMAYFQARLSLLGEPKTLNQVAQQRTFKLLLKAIGERMVNVEPGS
ncbi:hypothetical protein CKO31_13730 [Thiohalocapsa halophila]|uniref:Uncharacterized protein n=1 Tax=Thiohalocapsa halophila TaxID=69359 RepID=A0ABS1CIM0_9GAMM|nr:hypothetical protein [Thiohalocapsa halophila]MBK1631776.1 hypothetical protein [Thiohalocapsa halophila]